MLMVVSVYLGSSPYCDRKYFDLAYQVGRMLALKGHTLCYGGAAVGTMGSLAAGAMENGGKVIGVFPKGFQGTREIREQGIPVRQEGLDRMIEVADFAERKQLMEDMGDCAVVLPGSYGTMDELFTYACNHAIEKNHKFIHVLNFDGYYDHLIEFVETMEREHFLKGTMKDALIFHNTLDELAAAL